jgi:2-oxoglutarate ferredoxin oxidoreductase subunit alpha
MVRATREEIASPLETGNVFLQGNEACADGAVLAGCDFYGGYPITPSSEVMTRILARFGGTGGRFLQMEDEIASIAAVIGAAWAGARAMTATSGPGFSLMMENLGYAMMTETPMVLVNAQRVGPATGQATRPAQGDVMQARWGTHGGFPLIAVSPTSVQEMLTETVRAFNLAETYRTPVIVLADEIVAHLRERCVLPATVVRRRRWTEKGAKPFGESEGSLVPPMPKFGDGEKLMITGSTHDETGLRRTSSAQAQKTLGERLHAKIAAGYDDIVEVDRHFLDDAETVLVSFGFSARPSYAVAKYRRMAGEKIGLLTLRTLWPFPEREVREACANARRVVVVEMNDGQVVQEVRRVLSRPDVISCTRHDGEPLTPGDIEVVLQRPEPA